MVGVAQLVEHLVVVQVAAGSSPVTHPRKGPRPIRSGALVVACTTMVGMLMGNKKAQRITVGLIIGVIVVSLALSLISTASAVP